MDGEIELHVQVSVEKAENGHRQAKLARIPEQPEGEFQRECMTFRAWYPAQSPTDPTLVHSAHLATVWLYWPTLMPDEKTRERIYRRLKQTIRNYLRFDEYARLDLPIGHKSSGYYFVLAGAC